MYAVGVASFTVFGLAALAVVLGSVMKLLLPVNSSIDGLLNHAETAAVASGLFIILMSSLNRIGVPMTIDIAVAAVLIVVAMIARGMGRKQPSEVVWD